MSTAINTDGLTFKARWARRAVREKLSAEINALERGLSQWTPDNLPPDPSSMTTRRLAARTIHHHANPHLTYEILEASPRVGGRIYTHKLSDNQHDDYDIGAMRYPETPNMKRTFDLFNGHFNESGSDPHRVSISNGGCVPNDVVDEAEDLIEAAFRPYKKRLAQNFSEGLAELMKVGDFSTREFFKKRRS
ncbi:hypothetical protein F5Y01DRAFT_319067 [Xylaria sp. FL0043]|nr:hypothetical protein F5Y01DRAFT_319067 [Xylaria sp. FL0043]